MKTCKHGYPKGSCEICKFYKEHCRKKWAETYLGEKKVIFGGKEMTQSEFDEFLRKNKITWTADQLIRQGGFYD